MRAEGLMRQDSQGIAIPWPNVILPVTIPAGTRLAVHRLDNNYQLSDVVVAELTVLGEAAESPYGSPPFQLGVSQKNCEKPCNDPNAAKCDWCGGVDCGLHYQCATFDYPRRGHD
jgi:hypothetical protein